MPRVVLFLSYAFSVRFIGGSGFVIITAPFPAIEIPELP